MQPLEWQSRFKSSYYLEVDAEAQLATIQEGLEQRGIDAMVVYSANRFLDLLPSRSGKGGAVRYLAAGRAARAGALYDIAFVYEKVGEFEDALAAFEDAAAINPDKKTTDAIERVKERIRRQKSGS